MLGFCGGWPQIHRLVAGRHGIRLEPVHDALAASHRVEFPTASRASGSSSGARRIGPVTPSFSRGLAMFEDGELVSSPTADAAPPGPGRFRQRRGNPRADFRDGHEPRSSRPWGPDCCGPAVRGTTTAPAQPAVGRARRTGRCWHCSATGGPVTAGSWNANVGHGRHLPVVYFLALLSEEGEPTECGLAGRAAPGGPGPEDAQGPRPAHRRDTPDFWERAADVCTLYLGPPEGAVVHGWPRTHAGTSTGPHHTPPGPIRPSCSSPPWPAGSCDTATSPAATT